jgi:hypothetical protein
MITINRQLLYAVFLYLGPEIKEEVYYEDMKLIAGFVSYSTHFVLDWLVVSYPNSGRFVPTFEFWLTDCTKNTN